MIRCAAVLFVAIGLAIAEPWNLAVDANLTLGQNAHGDNRGGGATGLLARTFNSNSPAEGQLSSKVSNKNTLKLAFGQTATQDTGGSRDELAKATDEIDCEPMFRFTLGEFARVRVCAAWHLWAFLAVSTAGRYH